MQIVFIDSNSYIEPEQHDFEINNNESSKDGNQKDKIEEAGKK